MLDLRPKRRWAVANVFTGAELRVVKRLEKLGCEVWCPTCTVTRRVGPRRREESFERASFDSYLFVNFETVGDLEAVYFTEDFIYFVRSGEGRISLLADDEMAALRDLEAKGLLTPKIAEMLVKHFAAGDWVRAEASAFAGMHGIVEAVEKGRARVGQGDFEKPVWLPEDILDAAENGE